MKVITIYLTLSILLAACMPAIQPEAAPTPLPATPPRAENTPESAPETSSEDPLAGTSWVLESYGTPGAETPVVGETPLTLEFANDGNVGGNGGCNSFGGPYQVEGNELTFGELISTLVACADSAQMEQEVRYLDALATVSAFQLEGDSLVISYNEGQEALNFVSATAGPTEEEVTPTETPEPEAEAPSAPPL
jgi:heat shock protein HslJ